jgi:hypothetical protein
MRPRVGTDAVKKREIFCSCRESNSGSPGAELIKSLVSPKDQKRLQMRRKSTCQGRSRHDHPTTECCSTEGWRGIQRFARTRVSFV